MIEISVIINSRLEKVWDYWTGAAHIRIWNAASAHWHTTKVENNLKETGRFVYRMEAKDASAGFDFCGTYTRVELNEVIEYTLDDGRQVIIRFHQKNGKTEITERFEPDEKNSTEVQEKGWQAILNNFKTYVENRGSNLAKR